ncbi:MAG: hypothetical protein ACOYEW_01435 [Anaerolineae bacterium]|jgi:hypothetical protein
MSGSRNPVTSLLGLAALTLLTLVVVSACRAQGMLPSSGADAAPAPTPTLPGDPMAVAMP